MGFRAGNEVANLANLQNKYLALRAHEVEIRSYISARLVGGEFQISTPETVSTPEKLSFFPAGGEFFVCFFGTKPFRNALFLVQKIYNAHQKDPKIRLRQCW